MQVITITFQCDICKDVEVELQRVSAKSDVSARSGLLKELETLGWVYEKMNSNRVAHICPACKNEGDYSSVVDEMRHTKNKLYGRLS